MAAKESIAVIGGGLMGAAIAQVFASAGHPVRVHEPMAPVRDSFQSRLAELLRSYQLDPSALSRVQVTADMVEAVSHAHFVTEAAPERLELKQAVFAELVRHAPRDAILASNTSVIPIHRIVGDLPTAERMLGTHWWHPAGLIPLVEVVQSKQTSPEVVSRVMEILRSVGKAPAHVTKDTPGFVANRLQHALWREAIAMVEEGVCDAATLDHCVKMSFGRRLAVLGPLENADMVGLDLTLDIHKVMMPELYRASGPHPYLESRVAAGQLGFKSGSGFRDWSEEDMLGLRRRLAEHLLKAKDQLPS
jgi:3-hydroxybutyryl-CoA dehydrogenase